MDTITTVRDMNVRSADMTLAFLLTFHAKKDLIGIADRLDLYVSPNITKEKMSQRLAAAVLANLIEIVFRLSKSELQLLDELVKAGPDAFVQRKQRKTYYMLQKLGLVVTYEDDAKGLWHMMMPDEVRTALQDIYPSYLEMALAGKKGPTAKQLRMASFMRQFLGHDDFTIIGNQIINHRADKE